MSLLVTPLNPSSIDVMLTNRKNSFQNSTTIETGLSDFHKMTITVLKTHFKKKEPIVVDYRKYKYFNEQNFRNDLTRQLEILSTEHFGYEDFEQIQEGGTFITGNINISMNKTHFKKKEPIVVDYRKYKYFNEQNPLQEGGTYCCRLPEI